MCKKKVDEQFRNCHLIPSTLLLLAQVPVLPPEVLSATAGHRGRGHAGSLSPAVLENKGPKTIEVSAKDDA